MVDTPCHIVVEGNPVVIYTSRDGVPSKILPILNRFLETFWQERETCGEFCDTPECLVAQIVVRFGFEMCEDDYSNLRVGIEYSSAAEYLYWISSNHRVQVWVPDDDYRQNPTLGIEGCHLMTSDAIQLTAH